MQELSPPCGQLQMGLCIVAYKSCANLTHLGDFTGIEFFLTLPFLVGSFDQIFVMSKGVRMTLDLDMT